MKTQITVEELIQELKKFPPSALVETPIHESTKRFPSEYIPLMFTKESPYETINQPTEDSKVRIHIWLPRNMYTVKRKIT